MPLSRSAAARLRGDYAALDLDFAGVAETSVAAVEHRGGTNASCSALTAQETNNNYIFLAGFKGRVGKSGPRLR